MHPALIEIIRRHSQALEPMPTPLSPRLERLPGIRCVMFDIYGTLLISGSGDVGTADEQRHESAFRQALNEVGIEIPPHAPPLADRIIEQIRASHAESQTQGIGYPEVEIREIWNRVLNDLAATGIIPLSNVSTETIERLSLTYEVLTNPVWPMPHLSACLAELKARGFTMGIISNAQFYTPMLFEALLGQDLEALGFPPNLRIFSYEHRQAKPGLFLYERARERVEQLGISPAQVLYIGNDMLKDIYPARETGFRTALFAGDARSLRLREEDERTKNLQPDLILTDLSDLPRCIAG